MLREDLFEKYKKTHPVPELQEEASYKPILVELSQESFAQGFGGSFDRISRLQNDKLSLLMKQAQSKRAMHSSMNEHMHRHNSWNMENKCNLSTLEDYIKRIGDVVENVLRRNPGGINIISMHQQISELSGEEFNPKKIGSENLVTFLVSHFSKHLDIRKAIHSPTGMWSIFVYPKGASNQKFASGYTSSQLDEMQSNLGLKLSSSPQPRRPHADSIDILHNSPDMQGSITPGQGADRKNYLEKKIHEAKQRQQYLFKSDIDASFAKEHAKKSSFALGNIGGFSATVFYHKP